MQLARLSLAFLALSGCSIAPASSPVKMQRICAETPPTDYAARTLLSAAGDWGCVELATENCDRRLVWRSDRPVIDSGKGAAGICVYRHPEGIIECGREAWTAGIASPLGTMLRHEMGHALGLDHRTHGIMVEGYDKIPLGGIEPRERRDACGLWAAGKSELD